MLAHYSAAARGVHTNERLARTLNKYKDRMKWEVLFYADCVDTAIEWERRYLEFFWGNRKLINYKKGDEFDAAYNERNKRKPVYAMNLWSGGVIKLNYVGEWGAMNGKGRWAKVPSAVYGHSIEECKRKRVEKITRDLMQADNKMPSKPAHVRNKHLYFIWTKTRKWIVWGGKEAKKITAGIDGEYWIKTRTRNWKHKKPKKPATKPIPVRLYRQDVGEIICASIGEACRVIGCSHMEVNRVLKRLDRRTTYGWTIHSAEQRGMGC